MIFCQQKISKDHGEIKIHLWFINMVVFSARKQIAKWQEILFLCFSCILLSVSISNIWYLYTHLYTHIINNLLHGWFVCTIFIIYSL